jgi:hypothetical protein
MSATKMKWIGFAGLGAALAAWFNRLRRRGEGPGQAHQGTRPTNTHT